jgi:hypothetical protein
MSEDVFRIIVGLVVVLAALAFITQAGVVIALYLESRKLRQLVTTFLGDAKPVLAQAGVVLSAANQIMDDQVKPVLATAWTVLNVAKQIMEDASPQIREITADGMFLVRSGREQVEQLGDFLHDASGRARARLEQIDNTVESAVVQIEQAGDTVKRAAMKPVKEASGLAAGISAAVSTLLYGSRKRR